MTADSTTMHERHDAEQIDPCDLPAWPQFDDAERQGLQRALEHGQWWRITGREIEAFEREFAVYNGAPHALAVTNGTAALELALRVHDIGPGDEVIVPAFTFIATSLAVQNVGATPVPADVDDRYYCLSASSVQDSVTARARAIIPVHMAGHVVDLDALQDVADAHGLAMIQDAAHAQGAVRDGALIGSHPTIACYSFQNGKLMTAGEGGALTFPDEASYERAYLLHMCGRPRGDVTYQHVTGGSNCRMSEFSAAVLRSQLERLSQHTPLRERRATLLDGLLSGVAGLSVQSRDPSIDVNPHYMYLLMLDEQYDAQARNQLVEQLKSVGIPACVNFPPVYRTQGFWLGATPSLDIDALAERCRTSEAIGARGLWLHHRVLLAEPDVVERVARIVEELVVALPMTSGVG